MEGEDTLDGLVTTSRRSPRYAPAGDPRADVVRDRPGWSHRPGPCGAQNHRSPGPGAWAAWTPGCYGEYAGPYRHSGAFAGGWPSARQLRRPPRSRGHGLSGSTARYAAQSRERGSAGVPQRFAADMWGW